MHVITPEKKRGNTSTRIMSDPCLLNTIAYGDEEMQLNIRPLQIHDLPFCTALEQASFPPNEAASLEQVNIALAPCLNRSPTEFKNAQKSRLEYSKSARTMKTGRYLP